MKNLLIITYSFPPNNSMSSHRFADLVKYMPLYGYNPWVITTKSAGDLVVPIPEDRIIRINEHHENNSNFLSKKRLKNHIFSFYKNYFYTPFLDSSYFYWCRKVIHNLPEICRKIKKVDFIIATLGPSAPIYIAYELSKIYNAPIIADFRDLPTGHSNIMSRHLNYIDNYLAKMIFKKMFFSTSISKSYCNYIKNKSNKICLLLYNGWEAENYSILKNIECNQYTNKFIDKSKPYLYYAGRFYSHRLESVKMLLSSMNVCKEYNLYIRSLGPVGLEKEIIKYANDINIIDRVKFLDKSSHKQVMIDSNFSKCNLVFETFDQSNTLNAGIITGKFMQLLPLKTPILAIARNDSEIGEILNDTKKGQLCSSINDIIKFLNKLNNEEINNCYDTSKIDKYSKFEQAKKLCQFLDFI